MKGNPDAATLSGEISRYLEDVSDANAREGAIEKAEKARDSGIGKLAAISHIKTFHSEESLSPVSGIAVAKDGRIFVSDEFNHRVLVYSPEFEQIAEIGSEGAGDGQFKYPRGLALDDDGSLYVADAWNHRVAVFGPDFKFNKNIGSLGEGPGRLDEPVGVVFFKGRLCVLEKSNHRVQAFDGKGNSVGTIGRRGSVGEQEAFYLTDVAPENFSIPVFEFPSSIATDGAGSLYVADTNNHRVVKLDSAWNDDSSFRLGGVRYPIGVACDTENNLHLAEFNREGVSVYSPDGALLYRYAPGDIQTPVAIAIGGGKAFVGGGMTAAVSAMEIDAEHDSRAVLENRFSRAFKDALSAFRDGGFGEALDALFLAAQAVEKPSVADFTALLPEHDYSFAVHEGGKGGEGGFDSPEKAEGFLSLLGGFREEILDGIDKALNEKLDAGKNFSRISLELEKEVLSGRESNETLMVERFRATKKLLSVSSEIKKKFYSLKKLDEFLQRLAAAGLGAGERLEQIKSAFARFARWKAVRNELYSNAEKLAPSLSFASSPEERAEFCENESGLSALVYEFNMLWRTCAGYNRELAALLRRPDSRDSGIFSGGSGVAAEELLWAAVDFFAFCAEGLNIRLEYLLSLEELIESFGAEELASVLGGMKDSEHWDIVGREDNIPRAASGTAYRLMPALWADAGYAPREKVSGDTWEKIVDFYNSEFRKFLNENSPLCVEFIRNEQLRKLADKGDPKQAAMVHRKAVLLGFHKFFQERYIGGMMAEYMIRFSLFALSENPLPVPRVEATEKGLEKLISEASWESFKAERALADIDAKRGDSGNLSEKNKLEVEANVIELGKIYHECLAAHLRIMRVRLYAKKGGGARPFRLKNNFYGPDNVNEAFRRPVALEFGRDGRLFVLSIVDARVFVLDGNCRFERSFAGYGLMEGKLLAPIDLKVAPDGSLFIANIVGCAFSVFSQEGEFIRGFRLIGDEGRQIVYSQFDSEGRLFVSFRDGKGISIYDTDGAKTGEISSNEGAFKSIGSIQGFAIKDDRLIIGGKGRFIIADIGGKEAESVVSSDIDFGNLIRIIVDEAGNVFGLDYERNKIVFVDAAFKSVRLTDGISTQSPTAIAAKNGLLAVGDLIANRVSLYEINI